VTIVGRTISATATYSASVPTNFGKIRIKSMALQGTSAASLTMPNISTSICCLTCRAPWPAFDSRRRNSPSPPSIPTMPASTPAVASSPAISPGLAAIPQRARTTFSCASTRLGRRRALHEPSAETQTLPNQYRSASILHRAANTSWTSRRISRATRHRRQRDQLQSGDGHDDFGKLLDSGDDSLFASRSIPITKRLQRPAESSRWARRHAYRQIFMTSARDRDGRRRLQRAEAAAFVFFISDGMEDSQSFVTATGHGRGSRLGHAPARRSQSARWIRRFAPV